MEESADQPLSLIILVGALSGVIGAVLGPALQRAFSRSDSGLAARRGWAKEKLQYVFGIGDEYSSDGPPIPFMRLVPPNALTPQAYDMHSINWATQESVDLMLLQPRRSRWAKQWLFNWHFVLQQEWNVLHRRMHAQRAEGINYDKAWERKATKYERRVQRVQSSLAIWATGRWLTHSSLRFWFGGRDKVSVWRQRASIGTRWHSNPSINVDAICDCIPGQNL